MPELIPILSRKTIEQLVSEMGDRISSDYRSGDLVLIGILKGAFVFLSDLIRHISIPLKIDFLRAASYGDGDKSSGDIRLAKKLEIDIRNKDVLIVEDIIDTGLTIKRLIDHLSAMQPRSLRVCAFIDKTERRQIAIQADYVGYEAKEGFLVGYGLDYAENYRQLPEVYHLKL